MPRQMLGDVARMQLGAAVDVGAVALRDDRNLHDASEPESVDGSARRSRVVVRRPVRRSRFEVPDPVQGSRFAVRRSVRGFRFAVRRSSLGVHRSSLVAPRSSLAVRRPSLVVRRPRARRNLDRFDVRGAAAAGASAGSPPPVIGSTPDGAAAPSPPARLRRWGRAVAALGTASGRYCTTASSARARRSLKSSRPGHGLDAHLDALYVDAGSRHLDHHVVHAPRRRRVVPRE